MRALTVAAFVSLLATPPTANALAPSSMPAAFASDCAAGSHADSGGTCHPDVAKVDRYCPAGTIYQPEVAGWSCEPFATRD